MQDLIVVGASDQALVVLDVLDRRADLGRVVAILDASEDGTFVGRQVAGVPVTGTLGDLDPARFPGCSVVPAIGSAEHRRKIAATADAVGMSLATVIDLTALVSTRANLDPGVFIGPRATVCAGARISTASIVNTGAIVEHHVSIGAYGHVGPGATVAGNCTLDESVTVGVGASVRDSIRIGARAVIGVGAVVVANVPADHVVVGNPARTLRG